MKLTFGVFLMGGLALLVGCQRGQANRTATIRNALTCSGFEYVGEAPDLPNRTVADHGTEQSIFPAQIAKGRQYIFHRKRNASLSWIALQDCLKEEGVSITDAPKGNVGLSYTYLGGPLYVVEFRLGEARYTFQNSVARELESGRLSSAFEQQDFVLRRE